MHIILVSNRMATARSITLTRGHIMLFFTGLMVMVLTLSSVFSYWTMRHAAEIRLPFLQELLHKTSYAETSKTRELVRENLSNMAVRLGQMQGQLLQLDSLGERLAGLAGVKLKDIQAPQDDNSAANAGRGGPLLRPDNLSEAELKLALDDLARQVEVRGDTLATLESRMYDERIRQSLLPTARPVANDARASGFGWRVDPFTGQTSMHEGIDFMAGSDTPILAAAAGIVKNVERHSEYGNLTEIDHGNGLTTRYAHASQVLVKEGQFVKRGEEIARVGSTGRSTGPHLHFEVRIDGVAQNPALFLDKGATTQLARFK